ncbi:hypothetical protein KX928_17410 [Roseobacter sp. YSTF-M11]|uniref:Uncharacterized protein n=1 Tax=Roseobacter insulae TaxID=2859783 RepID=A0A9X1FXP6_9RHOB|nr:hypothetical protein [Roseobacter insulae]MBW4709567.1 hypothetical protein [Roseobacter insulae]
MALETLDSDWLEIIFPPDENYRNLKNLDSIAAVTLVFADEPPQTPAAPTWDVYRLAPGERVNILFSTYRPRVFVHGNNVSIDVVSSFTLMGADPGAGPISTLSPRASGVK